MSTIARGAAWMVLFRLADRSLGIVSTLVLARLLVPADFGLVAMATSIIAVVELATAFSFEVVLIQRTQLERAHYNTAWTLGALLGLGCSIVLVLLAYPSALFYAEPRVAAVMLVLALGTLIGSLENPGIVDFRRAMDFRREFTFLFTKRIIAFSITVAGAVVMHSYWALVIGTVLGRFAGLTLSYVMHPFRPRPSLQSSRELLSFSSWLLVNNAVITAIVRFPHFLIGRMFGAQGLGYFAVAYDFGTLPVTELAAPVNRAVFPGYSRLAANTDELREGFLNIASVVLCLALPASVGIAAIAQPLVRTLLGEQWLEVAPLIAVLAVSAAVIAAQTNNGLLHVALARAKLNTAVSFSRLVALVPLCYWLAPRFGVLGVAYAELLASVVCLLASFPYVLVRLHISPLLYISRVWRPVVASVAMGAVVTAVLGMLGTGVGTLDSVRELAVAVPVGVAAYALALAALWFVSGRPAGAERLIWERGVGTVLPRLRLAAAGPTQSGEIRR